MSDVEDVLGTISGWLDDIKKEIDEDVEKTSVNPRSVLRLVGIYKLYTAANKEELLKIGDCLASKDGAKLFTDYIRMLTDGGKSDPESGSGGSKYVTLLEGLCCNYSHVSLNFCLELGKAGLFEILITRLERHKDSLEEIVDEDEFILPSLTILYNCAKDPRARRYLAQANVAGVLPPFITMKNKRLILSKIVAILASSYPIEEGHSEKPADSAMLFVIVFYLQSALSESGHKHLGFTAEELVYGLKRLADNDLNKVSILNAGVLPLLEKLLQTGDVAEQTIGALTLWSLCFAEENKPKVTADKSIMSSLQKLGKQPGELGHLSSGALWFLSEKGRPATTPKGQRSLKSESGDGGVSREHTEKHIMISYSSRQKILALKVKARLENSRYRAWMDMDGIEGKNFDAVKEAIEKSELVLVIVSQDYKAQPCCRMEAEYARRLQIPMVSILTESDYEMSGWLRVTLGCSAWIDFSDSASFETAFSSLIKEVGNKGKAESGETRFPETMIRPDESEVQHSRHDEASSRTSIEIWTTNEVTNWATENNLAPAHFQNVDGESLAYLRDMKKNSPEFYHKYVVEKLGITDLQDLKNLGRGLENLKL